MMMRAFVANLKEASPERFGQRVLAFEVDDAEGFESGIETFSGQGAPRR